MLLPLYARKRFYLWQRNGRDTGEKSVAFFELDVQLSVPSVSLRPTLEDVQASVNKAAVSVLGCSKRMYDWGEAGVAESDRFSFFEALGSDLEIVKTLLLLTGASYGAALQASEIPRGCPASSRIPSFHDELSFVRPCFQSPIPACSNLWRQLFGNQLERNRFAQILSLLPGVGIEHSGSAGVGGLVHNCREATGAPLASFDVSV